MPSPSRMVISNQVDYLREASFSQASNFHTPFP